MIFNIKDNSTPTQEEYIRIVSSLSVGISTMVAMEAFLLAKVMKVGLIEQRPGGKSIERISRNTIILRGMRTKSKGGTGTKALIASGSMVNAVNARRESTYHYTAGVHRNARSKDGKRLADIAAIHEYGTKTYYVTVTEKMRGFSFVLMKVGILNAPWKVGQKLRRKIKARPWLNPAHDQWEEDADERFVAGLSAILGVSR